MTTTANRRASRAIALVLLGTAAMACSEAPLKPSSRVTPKVVVGDVPCGPDKVLKHVCQFCHTNPPQHGAPFPLVTYANTQAELDGKPIWYWMEKYVSEEIMPLPPVEISDADRAVLLAWLRAGAPPRETGVVCDGDGGVIQPDTDVPRDGAVGSDAARPDTLEGTDTEEAADAGASDASGDDGQIDDTAGDERD